MEVRANKRDIHVIEGLGGNGARKKHGKGLAGGKTLSTKKRATSASHGGTPDPLSTALYIAGMGGATNDVRIRRFSAPPPTLQLFACR